MGPSPSPACPGSLQSTKTPQKLCLHLSLCHPMPSTQQSEQLQSAHHTSWATGIISSLFLPKLDFFSVSRGQMRCVGPEWFQGVGGGWLCEGLAVFSFQGG